MIPCLNEEAGIARLHRELSPVLEGLAPLFDVELLFVDDGSTDATVGRIGKAWEHASPRIVSHDHTWGLGAALWTGTQAATGELVLFIDSDCTYRPKEIPALLSLLDAGTDIVTASPYHPLGRVVGVPTLRLAPSRVLSVLYRLVAGSSMWTYTSMFRVYRRSLLASLPRWSAGYVALAEMLILPLLAGARVREFPTALYARPGYSASKMKLLRTVKSHLRFLARVATLRLRGPARSPVVDGLDEASRASIPRT